MWANWFAGRSPSFSGRRQPSRDGTSRMMREYPVRICEGLGVKFPGPTRPLQPSAGVAPMPALTSKAVIGLRRMPPDVMFFPARYVKSVS
jgi:hypothetical protein